MEILRTKLCNLYHIRFISNESATNFELTVFLLTVGILSARTAVNGGRALHQKVLTHFSVRPSFTT